MRRLFAICALLLLLVSGCTSVTEQDLADLQSANAVAKREALGRIAKGPAFPLNLLPPLFSNGNEEEAVTIMVNMLRNGREAKETELSILKALGRMAKRTKVPSSSLIDKLKDRDPAIRRRAIAAVAVAKCHDALPALVKLLDEEQNKYIVIWALGELGDPAAIPRLNQLLASADEYDRYNAERALGKIGGDVPTGDAPVGEAPPMFDQKDQKSVRGREGSGSTTSGKAVAMAEGKPRTNRAQMNEKIPTSPASNGVQQREASQPRQSVAMQRGPKKTANSIQREERKTRVSRQGRSAEGTAQKKPQALALAMGTERVQSSQVHPSAAITVNQRPKSAQIGTSEPRQVAAQPDDSGISEEAAALYLQGLAFQKEGSLEEAKKMYEAALKVSPNLASAWNNMGTIYMKERNYSSAIIAFQKALRIKPQDADPYYNLACLYALQKNVSQSLSYLRKAITVDEAARQWAMTDDDLKNLRGHSEFKKIVNSATSL